MNITPKEGKGKRAHEAKQKTRHISSHQLIINITNKSSEHHATTTFLVSLIA
jgi:hypothetical protein